jgi:hypothetical protein
MAGVKIERSLAQRMKRATELVEADRGLQGSVANDKGRLRGARYYQAPSGIAVPSSTTSPASATCTLMKFNGTSLSTTNTTETVYSLVPLVEDWIYECHQVNGFIFTVPVAVRLIGKSNGTITAGGSGSVDVYSDAATDTGQNVTAYLDWMDGGNDISAGKEVRIEWEPLEAIFRVVGAECEDVNLIQSVAASFSVTAENGTYYFADTGSGDITVTLPAAVSNFRYSVKKSDSSANSVIVQTADSALIDGDTTKTIVTPFDSITVVCDGRDWWIV